MCCVPTIFMNKININSIKILNLKKKIKKIQRNSLPIITNDFQQLLTV